MEKYDREELNYCWNLESKDQLNRLAGQLYCLQGYSVEVGFDFTKSKHPQEKSMFAMAAIAMNFFLDEGLE